MAEIKEIDAGHDEENGDLTIERQAVSTVVDINAPANEIEQNS